MIIRDDVPVLGVPVDLPDPLDAGLRFLGRVEIVVAIVCPGLILMLVATGTEGKSSMNETAGKVNLDSFTCC